MEKHIVENSDKPLAAMRLAEKGMLQGAAITKRGMILSGPALVIASALFGSVFGAFEAGGRAVKG